MKKSAFLMATGTAMTLATAAFAQPAIDLDLGTLSNPQIASGSVTIAPNEVKWIKFVIPSTTRAAAQYLDIYTNGGTLADTFPRVGDTFIGLFDSAGAVVATNDDEGPSLYSQLSFGDTAPARAAIAFTGNATANGATRTGTNGANLAAGTYYLAVTNYGHASAGTTFAAGWTVTGTHNGTGDATVTLELGTDTTPSNPTMTVAATPNTGQVAATSLFTATVVPGTFPSSTGITVTGDLSLIGGSSTQAFLDNGLNGDAVAGDFIYSYNATVGAVAGGLKVLPIAMADAEGRTASANINFTVVAPPAVFTDLGSINCAPVDLTASVAAGEVKWYRMTLPAITGGAGSQTFVDMWTKSTSSFVDTEMGLYTNAGALVASDDDDGNGNRSQLTFGDTGPRINPDGGGAANLNGFDGALAAGTYWLAVAEYNTAFGAGWNVTTTGVAAGTIDFHIESSTPACAGSPTGVGNGGTAVGACGGSTLVTVAATGVITPPSTGLAVAIDLSALGGSASTAMFDNGTNGDVLAGDNIFSLSVNVPGGGDAVFALPFVVSDAQARSSNGSLNVTRANDVGDLPGSAKQYYGTVPPATTLVSTIGGNADSDMFAICINDTANFEASTNNGGAAFDTQLFLFNPDGTGAVMNDDEPDAAQTLQSHMMLNNSLLTGGVPVVLPAGGLYYLAVAGYDRDPITSATITDTIWADQATTPAGSFDATWTPNGATPTAPIVGWSGNSNNTGGDYTITLVGAATVCPADLANSGGAGPDCAVDINDLLFFLTAFEAGVADVADSSGNGNQDCATDINDLLYFLQRFEAGC